jgi:hypothetical protein
VLLVKVYPDLGNLVVALNTTTKTTLRRSYNTPDEARSAAEAMAIAVALAGVQSLATDGIGRHQRVLFNSLRRPS